MKTRSVSKTPHAPLVSLSRSQSCLLGCLAELSRRVVSFKGGGVEPFAEA